MKNAWTACILALAIPTAALACDGEGHAEVKKITVPELQGLQKAAAVQTVDANGADTRTKYGVIPGALLLTSSSSYDVSKELPADKAKKLVFYCANEKCTASKTAASRALEAGFTDVSILPEGIAGWRKAGAKTEVPRS